MIKFDPLKFNSLIQAGKKDEAKNYIDSCLNVDLSKSEDDGTIFEYTLAYMSAVNAVNEAYRDALNEILESLNSVDKNQRKMNDEIDLKKTRMELNS